MKDLTPSPKGKKSMKSTLFVDEKSLMRQNLKMTHKSTAYHRVRQWDWCALLLCHALRKNIRMCSELMIVLGKLHFYNAKAIQSRGSACKLASCLSAATAKSANAVTRGATCARWG